MKRVRRIFNPVLALIAIQLAWVVAVVLWVNWFIGKNRELREILGVYRPDLQGAAENWGGLVQGLVLLCLILAGVYALFIFWRRQSRLYQAQREFITQVTHELKSPLASIQLHLETMKMRQIERPQMLSFVDIMLDDTRRLHSQIENLLMVARLEHRRLVPEGRPYDLTAFIKNFCEEYRSRLSSGARFDVHVEEGLLVRIDSEALGMVLRNLLENAVHYSQDAPEIGVSVVKSGRFAVLQIKDNGFGLTREQIKMVFKRFYRVDQPEERKRGTGLGLYIVASVMRDVGGSVSVVSPGLGLGSTFTLQIPLSSAG